MIAIGFGTCQTLLTNPEQSAPMPQCEHPGQLPEHPPLLQAPLGSHPFAHQQDPPHQYE
ncbi:MAG: hypothetical protein FJ087_21970 [Deltaproteobacteria bacterium]|nr:hypothetical protein [Deltaproteobacteria bacterium]